VTTEVEVGLKSQVTSEENLLVVASSISNGSAVRDTPQNVGNLAFRGKTSKIEQDSTK
jgi:hypothetical protein